MEIDKKQIKNKFSLFSLILLSSFYLCVVFALWCVCVKHIIPVISIPTLISYVRLDSGPTIPYRNPVDNTDNCPESMAHLLSLSFCILRLFYAVTSQMLIYPLACVAYLRRRAGIPDIYSYHEARGSAMPTMRLMGVAPWPACPHNISSVFQCTSQSNPQRPLCPALPLWR